MKENLIIPDFIYDQTSYYIKLQEQAGFLEKGDYENLERAYDDSDFIKYKNARISPIYAQLVGIIKHIRNTEENQIIEEYNHLKNMIIMNKVMLIRVYINFDLFYIGINKT